MTVPRLLVLTERFPPDLGGVSRSAGRMATAFGQLGLAVDVVTWSRFLQPGEMQCDRPESPPENPLTIYRIGQYRHWDMTLPITLNCLDWLHEQFTYDAVWGHYLFPAGFLAVWWGGLKGVTHCVSARGNDIDRAIFPPGDFARLQWTLANADWVTAVSQDLAGKIQHLVPRDRVRVLPNAVDPALFCPQLPSMELRQSLGIAPNERVLGFSGELREKKGQTILLDTLAQVRQQYPACLLIIGEVRPSQVPVLQSYAAQYPEAAQRMITTGHLPDPHQVVQALNLCDLYLQPSLWDGFPNALLEAMACGCCCLASDAGGIPEMLVSGQEGFLVPRAQLTHFGQAAIELLEQPPEFRHHLGTAARDRILAEFTLEREQKNLGDLIKALIGRDRTSIPNPS